jgi:hypothetical protein
MRTSIGLIILLLLLRLPCRAQNPDDDALLANVPNLIENLVSPNDAPPIGAVFDYKYPAGYDRKKQEVVNSARRQLATLGPRAYKKLIENWTDKRYSLTYRVGINGYRQNATVGGVCRRIMYDQIQPYGFWPRTNDDPRSVAKRPSYPHEFLSDTDSANKWVEENSRKTLYEIQLIAIDWVIAEENRKPKKYTDEERTELAKLRKELTTTKMPILNGNYFMDDYE